MAPTHSKPIWTDRSEGLRPPMTANRAADVVVIGAGIAGLTTALLLAGAGREVVVLEGAAIGAGTTGHTKVSALQGVRYQTLAEHHRPELVAAYAPRPARRRSLGGVARRGPGDRVSLGTPGGLHLELESWTAEHFDLDDVVARWCAHLHPPRGHLHNMG